MQQPAMTPGADQPGYTIPYGPMAGFQAGAMPAPRSPSERFGGSGIMELLTGRTTNSDTANFGQPQYDAWHLPPWMQQGAMMMGQGAQQGGVNTGGPMSGRPPGGNPRTDAIRALGQTMTPQANRTAARVDARQDRRAVRRA